MKIIKKLISFTTVIFSLFFIISCSKTASTTFSIELLNIEASGINNETVYQGFSYSKSSSVIITATFSDGTEKNVTNDAKFGKISTSKVGPVEQNVNYTFNGKTVSTTYEVLVLDYSSQRINLDTANVKTIYNLNEKLTLNNLRVTAFYPNGAQIKVSQYDVELTDIYNVKCDINKTFIHDGVYDVKISYQNCNSSFSIMVYNDEMTSFHYKVSNSLDYEKNQNVNFLNGKDLFKSLYANVYMKGENCTYDYNALTYNEMNYEASLKIKSSISNEKTDGLTIAVTRPVKVVMLIRLDANTLSIRDSSEMVIKRYGITSGVGYVSFELEAGTYTISSVDSYAYIYDLYFVYDSNLNLKKYDTIEIDKSSLKDEYHYNDSFDVNNFKVNGIIGSSKEVLDVNNYRIQLYYKGNEVSDFSFEGEYQIKLSYIGNDLCDEPVKRYSINFNFTDMDKLYLSKIVVNGVLVDISKNQFSYYIIVDKDITEVSLELESVGEGIITVNGIEYTKGMKVSIGKESIKINVTDGSRTTGYELIIRE